MFEKLIYTNCFSKNRILKKIAANFLEKLYCCEINCSDIDPSVRFAHHARGCTVIASKICRNVVIFQNVTIGSNLRFNKTTNGWENVGNPIIGENTVICDGAKVLGPIVIGKNTTIAAGAIVTKNIPANSIVYNVNQYKPKDETYDLVFSPNMIKPKEIIEANNKLVSAFREKL